MPTPCYQDVKFALFLSYFFIFIFIKHYKSIHLCFNLKILRMKRLLLLGVVLFGFISAKAQIAVWNFTSSTDPEIYSATNVDENAIASDLSISSGSVQYKTSAPITTYGSSFSTNATFSATGKYFEVSIAPKSGYKLTVTGISFDAGRTSSGPNKIDAYYSTNDFSNSTLIGSFTNDNTSTLSSFDGGAINLTVDEGETLKIRFWGYDASGTGNLRINNIIVAGASATLPISLTSFTAKAVDKSVLLNWTTASEKGNQKFEVLKSADGKTFRSIATINGAGSSDNEKSYTFVDENPFSGVNYYQLKQTDFNGISTTSNAVSADVKIEDIKLSVYASTDKVAISISSPNKTEGKIALFNINGKTLDSKNIILNKGYNEIVLNQSLQQGIYFVNLISAGKSTNLKFVR